MARQYPKIDKPDGVGGVDYVVAIPEEEISFDTSSGHSHNGVDSKLIEGGGGGGDMYKSTYDTNEDGKVDAADDADTVGGESPEAFEDAGTVATHAGNASAHHAKYTDGEAVTAAKADADISDAISKKHSNSLDHDGSTQDTAIAAKTTLTEVKEDSDIADTISKKHSNALDHSNSLDHTQNTDTDLDSTFEASLLNCDNHTNGSTNKVFTGTEQTKLSGIEASAVALSTVKADSDIADAISKKHTEAHSVASHSDTSATGAQLDELIGGGQTSLHSHSGGGGGDMLASTYDPQSVQGDAFDTDNHTDGTTNKVYTATEKTKLSGIEASAVALATVKADADISDAISKKHTEAHSVASHSDTSVTGAELDADHSKLAGIESGATTDQTGAEIKTLYEGEADTNAYTDAEKTKLSGIATGADVTADNAPQAHASSHSSGQSDAIDHGNLANSHNLTTDIDHNQLTNYSADEHFTKASFMSGVAKITVGTDQPSNPSAGDLWIDTN